MHAGYPSQSIVDFRPSVSAFEPQYKYGLVFAESRFVDYVHVNKSEFVRCSGRELPISMSVQFREALLAS